MKDYLITKHGIEPLPNLQSDFWIALRKKGYLLYDEAIKVVYGIKPETQRERVYYLKALSQLQNQINKKIEGLIVRKNRRRFEYLSESQSIKMAEENRIWKMKKSKK